MSGKKDESCVRCQNKDENYLFKFIDVDGTTYEICYFCEDCADIVIKICHGISKKKPQQNEAEKYLEKVKETLREMFDLDENLKHKKEKEQENGQER